MELNEQLTPQEALEIAVENAWDSYQKSDEKALLFSMSELVAENLKQLGFEIISLKGLQELEEYKWMYEGLCK